MRHAVASWFSPPAVAGLNAVYPARARQVMPEAYLRGVPAGTPSGMVAWPYVREDRERQASLTGGTVRGKELSYRVALMLRFLSNQQLAEDAQDDYDDIVESIKERLRSDFTFGGTVWAAGVGDDGRSWDVEHHADLPHPVGNTGTLILWGVLEFTVLEQT